MIGLYIKGSSLPSFCSSPVLKLLIYKEVPVLTSSGRRPRIEARSAEPEKVSEEGPGVPLPRMGSGSITPGNLLKFGMQFGAAVWCIFVTT